MIGFLAGSVDWIGPDRVTIDVHGVGFEVRVPTRLAATLRVGAQVRVPTALVVREDGFELYGFSDATERGMFEVLRSVTKVGPKLALAILSAMSADDVARAVQTEDARPFQSVTGIGAKTAKLIVVQLAGRLAPVAPRPGEGAAGVSAETPSLPPAAAEQVVAALIGLGWDDGTARDAVVAAAASGETASDALLKAALQSLGPSEGVNGGVR